MLVRDKVSVRIGQESGWYRGNFIRPSIVRGTDFYYPVIITGILIQSAVQKFVSYYRREHR